MLDAPDAPIISGYNGQEVEVNTLINLNCESSGGNPPSIVTWYRNGQVVSYSQSHDKFTFVVTTQDHKANFTCGATNTVTSAPLSKSYLFNVTCKSLVNSSNISLV